MSPSSRKKRELQRELGTVRWILGKYLPRWGPLWLRLALGAVFMAHGWEKLSGPLGTAEGFNILGWNWPYPELWAWLVALVETFGGLFIIVGLFTRIAAALTACVMVVAILKVKMSQGFVGGFELEFTLLMISISLVVAGPGRLSVDRDILAWGRRRSRPPTAESPQPESALTR